MIIQEAYSIAADFVEKHNKMVPAHSDIKWRPGPMTEFTECYYFEYVYTHADGRDWHEAPLAGGEAGFVVSKYDGYAQTISLVDLAQLRNEEKRMDELYELALNVKKKKAGLDIIKSRYNLNTQQLLVFLKVIQQETFDRLTVTAKLQEITKNIRQRKQADEMD